MLTGPINTLCHFIRKLLSKVHSRYMVSEQHRINDVILVVGLLGFATRKGSTQSAQLQRSVIVEYCTDDQFIVVYCLHI